MLDKPINSSLIVYIWLPGREHISYALVTKILTRHITTNYNLFTTGFVVTCKSCRTAFKTKCTKEEGLKPQHVWFFLYQEFMHAIENKGKVYKEE